MVVPTACWFSRKIVFSTNGIRTKWVFRNKLDEMEYLLEIWID